MSDFDARAKAEAALPEPDNGRQVITASNRNPVDVADDVADMIAKQNDPPRLFMMGDTAAYLEDDGTLKPFDDGRWLYYVLQRADFHVPASSKVGGTKTVTAPGPVMRLVPVAVAGKLPVLDGVAHTPYLDADGNVVAEDGYNLTTRLALHCGGLILPRVPGEPSQDELSRAVRLLTVDWLGDFPFTSAADNAHAIALLLTLTGRAFFGLAPMTVIDASTSGSGKNLLITTISLIATGDVPSLRELPADGEEQRKQITTALLTGNDLIVWDESHIISGRTLARILTADRYSDRLLGGNKEISLANRFTQVALGNNVQVWGDLKRRVVPVRLEPEQEHPEDRSDFRHANLAGWVRDNRGELLAAALTIWRAWIGAGRPKSTATMGSYERWAGAVGGALETAGIPGFLAGGKDWLDLSDPDADAWAVHLQALRNRFGDRAFTVKDVAGSLLELPHLGKSDRPLTDQIGNLYRTLRGRWLGGLRLDRSDTLNSPTGGRTYTVRNRQEYAGILNGRNNPQNPQYPQYPQRKKGQKGHVTEGSEGSEADLVRFKIPEKPSDTTQRDRQPVTAAANGSGHKRIGRRHEDWCPGGHEFYGDDAHSCRRHAEMMGAVQ